jgi:type IV pilus assembly protein PilO
MALLEKVNELNNKQRLLILVAVIAVIGVLFYLYPVKKAQTEIAGLTSRLTAVQGELQGLQAIAAKLPEFRATIESLQKQLADLRTKLPQDKDIPLLLKSISEAGTGSGMHFDLFRPQGEVKKEYYSELPVNITVRGPFHSMVTFMDKIAHLPRIVNITSFNFAGSKEEGGYLFVTGTGMATTYRYNEKS